MLVSLLLDKSADYLTNALSLQILVRETAILEEKLANASNITEPRSF